MKTFNLKENDALRRIKKMLLLLVIVRYFRPTAFIEDCQDCQLNLFSAEQYRLFQTFTYLVT